MDGRSAEVPKGEPIDNRSELAERFVLEQKNSFYLSAQKRIDQTVHVLDSLAVPGKDIASDLPDLINQSGLPMPEALPSQIAQLKDMKSTASLDEETLVRIVHAHQLQDKIWGNERVLRQLEEAGGNQSDRIQTLQQQIDTDKTAFTQMLGGEDYLEAWHEFDNLGKMANPIIHLNTEIVSGYVADTIDGVIADRSKFVDAISESEVVQDELFNHALGVVRPRLELLIEQGILPRQLAEEYLHLVRAQHNTAKTETQDPNMQQRAQRINLLVDTIPALESVNKIMTGIENRSYKQIFELLIKEKSGPILQQMKQEIAEMEFEHTAKEYFDYLVHSKWSEVAPVSPWQMFHSLSDEAKMLWEVVRTSPLGQAFTVKSWEDLEARMVPELYSQIAREYQFVLSGRFTTFYDFFSITKENHQLGQPYLIRILNGLASEGDDRKVAPALYLFLKNLSTEDLTYLQQSGFPEILQLTRITESHPQTFYTSFSTLV